MSLPYSMTGNNWEEKVLQQIIRMACSSPHSKGVCLRIGAAHGYQFQDEFVQTESLTAQFEIWGDNSGRVTQGEIKFDVDLREVLTFVSGEPGQRRVQADEMDQGQSQWRGRFAHLFVAVGERGAWLWCRKPFNNPELDCLDRLHLLMDTAYRSSA